MRRASLAPLVLAALSLAGCVRNHRPEPPPPTLPSVANALFTVVEGEGALASAYVVDAKTGAPLYAHREHVRMLPASTMKVVSTAAALSALGADFRFRTPVRLEGVTEADFFNGDLVAEASGDPSLGSWRYPETATACDQIAEALWARGIRQWRGRVRVRGTDEAQEGQLGPGWAWDDAAYAYSVAPTTFAFRENVVDLTLQRPEGAACTVLPTAQVTPAFATFAATVSVDTKAERAGLGCVRDRTGRVRCVWRSPENDCPRAATTKLAIDEPQVLFSACVEDALTRRGITRVPGPIQVELAPPPPLVAPASDLLMELLSPPLSELVKQTNKESLNLYAERLGLRFARERTGAESYAAYRAATTGELTRRGIPTRDLRPVDGSGLSRYNLATSRGLVRLIYTSIQEPYADVFLDSLPVAGQDGTLAPRPVTDRTRGRIRAKTGTMSGQKAFVGVIERPHDAEHPRVVFALMLGNMDEQPTYPATQIFDRFAEALVTLPLR
jgi:D-alanyl-D-alanine carboxypeptidase/D-alanyl-D-alanine-endopeptidase (penicillin-binding protein 4)